MTSLLDLPTPPIDASCAERISTAGGWLWDYAEGMLTREELGFYRALVVGWMDLCSEADREQYRGMVRQFEQALRGDAA